LKTAGQSFATNMYRVTHKLSKRHCLMFGARHEMPTKYGDLAVDGFKCGFDCCNKNEGTYNVTILVT